MADTVLVVTSLGELAIELDRARAPVSVENFLRYVDAGHYDGTIFHRVIGTHMIQGGGYDAAYVKRPVGAPIANEANNGVKNVRGTVAMARTGEPHSATAQFFVNVADCPIFDHQAPTDRGWGYAVFGRVARGMEVVDAIRAVKTGATGPFTKDAPLVPVVIHSARRGA